MTNIRGRKKGFEKGDIVKVSYISTTDPINDQRHMIIHRPCKIIEISEKKHPNLQPYKGGDPWFSALVEMTENEDTYYLETCQLIGINRPTDEFIVKDEIRNVLHKSRTTILYNINNILQSEYDPDHDPLDVAFWKSEWEKGKDVESAYVESGENRIWFIIKHKRGGVSFKHKLGEVMFRYAKEKQNEEFIPF